MARAPRESSSRNSEGRIGTAAGPRAGGQGAPEPFRIKVVEPVRAIALDARRRALADAGFNLFRLRSEDVFVDLLTDSGTGAMSHDQWAALQRGDEAYAGARSFYELAESVRSVFGFERFLPTHQGRAAERILFSSLVEPGDVVPANHFFDTTRAHVQARGAKPVDLAASAALDPESEAPFKGDLDLRRLEELLASGARVPLVLATITDNAGGGQPVSLRNLEGAARLAHEHGIPFVLDACRFAENAWFVQRREGGQRGRPVPDIVRSMFDLCDAFTFSAKKDGLANIGGLLGLRDEALLAKATESLILNEGFTTYGGLAGRDLGAIAVGLREVLSEDYLASRVGQVGRLHAWLTDAGIPLVRPAGGHAVYVNAGKLLRAVPVEEFPGHSFACELYLEGGIRSCEIGSLMFGNAEPPSNGARLELTRLAVPRRVYTDNHLAYVAECAARVAARAEEIRGFRILEAPAALRHFSARLEPVPRRTDRRVAGTLPPQNSR